MTSGLAGLLVLCAAYVVNLPAVFAAQVKGYSLAYKCVSIFADRFLDCDRFPDRRVGGPNVRTQKVQLRLTSIFADLIVWPSFAAFIIHFC